MAPGREPTTSVGHQGARAISHYQVLSLACLGTCPLGARTGRRDPRRSSRGRALSGRGALDVVAVMPGSAYWSARSCALQLSSQVVGHSGRHAPQSTQLSLTFSSPFPHFQSVLGRISWLQAVVRLSKNTCFPFSPPRAACPQ
jgi:hypothetical protein